MHRASRIVLGALLVGSIVLLGCTGRPTPAITGAGADLAAEQSVRLNLSGEPGTLDPSRASFATEITVIDQVFRGPLKFDANLKLVPDMAVEVPTRDNKGVSEDGLTYTIRLKPGLKWSDGTPITSKDLAYALRRGADPRTAGTYASFVREIRGGAEVAAMKPDDGRLDAALAAMAIETPDAQTTRVTLAKPNAVFVNYLGLWIAYPLREDVIKAKGDRWIEPGTPVGEEALDRLKAAVDEIRGIEPAPALEYPVPGIVLGRVPAAFAEARLAAAAVLAAVDVHRRRASM